MAYPWEYEPDQMYWVHKDSGYHCEVRRNHGGAWCGYVEIPRSHPWCGMDVTEIPVRCHGGLTYAGNGKHGGWVIGFDCNHYSDYSPVYAMRLLRNDGKYRDIIYVTHETEHLAAAAWSAEVR